MRKNIIVDLGKAEATLPYAEQTQGEMYKFGDRIKCYITEVKDNKRTTNFFVKDTSRIGKKTFELEVPEIYDGTVEIKVYRESPVQEQK